MQSLFLVLSHPQTKFFMCGLDVNSEVYLAKFNVITDSQLADFLAAKSLCYC